MHLRLSSGSPVPFEASSLVVKCFERLKKFLVINCKRMAKDFFENFKNCFSKFQRLFLCFQGPNLYFCDNDGTRIPGKLFSCGSGSLNAYGVLDRFYKPKMSDKDAIDLGLNKRIKNFFGIKIYYKIYYKINVKISLKIFFVSICNEIFFTPSNVDNSL